jgi:hypothetical protein
MAQALLDHVRRRPGSHVLHRPAMSHTVEIVNGGLEVKQVAA